MIKILTSKVRLAAGAAVVTVLLGSARTPAQDAPALDGPARAVKVQPPSPSAPPPAPELRPSVDAAPPPAPKPALAVEAAPPAPKPELAVEAAPLPPPPAPEPELAVETAPPPPPPAPEPQPAVEAAPTPPAAAAPPADTAEQPAPPKAAAEKGAVAPRKPAEELCALIETAASDHDIPIDFFTRLIWKESRFRADAVSPKGAQGIAQFMPGTAAERGLLDPFDPVTAIPASANLLADLSARFGNVGLAAAAYNAGAQRVADWLADTGTLPWETQDYVLSITGIPAETWAAPAEAATPPPEPPPPEPPPADSLPTEAAPAPPRGPPPADAAAAPQTCMELAAILKIRVPSPGPPGPRVETAAGPWGVQVAGNFSRARAVAAYSALQKRFPALVGKHSPMIISGRLRGRGTRAFFKVRVPMRSRDEAEQFCAKLRAAGGSCVVLKT